MIPLPPLNKHNERRLNVSHHITGVTIQQPIPILHYLLGKDGGLVVLWLGHRTCDQQVTSLTHGHALPDSYLDE